MNRSQLLLKYLEQLKQQGVLFDSLETLQALESLKEITQNKIIIEKIIANISIIYNRSNIISGLTKRQNEIFNLISLGFTSAEISKLLSISLQTVATHRKNIIKKLNLSGFGQLQKMAYLRSRQVVE